MDMDQASVFLAGSILTTMGFIVIAIGFIVVNNLIAKYWKNLGWFTSMRMFSGEPARFATPEELEKIKQDQVK
jgi:hypothetical protein